MFRGMLAKGRPGARGPAGTHPTATRGQPGVRATGPASREAHCPGLRQAPLRPGRLRASPGCRRRLPPRQGQGGGVRTEVSATPPHTPASPGCRRWVTPAQCPSLRVASVQTAVKPNPKGKRVDATDRPDQRPSERPFEGGRPGEFRGRPTRSRVRVRGPYLCGLTCSRPLRRRRFRSLINFSDLKIS